MGTTSFTQLTVWQKAHQVTLSVYKITKNFPSEERFGLSAQMRKAATSIPANIAEGYGRQKPADKGRFYNIGQGSAEELRYYLILSKDLGYVEDQASLWNSLDEVSRMLRRLAQVTVLDS